MATMLYQWLFLFGFINIANVEKTPVKSAHPIFVSVTEIEHNAKEKTLEISCKLFTDDFEKTLRKQYPLHIDLLNEKLKQQMGVIVNDYIQKHFSITADGKKISLRFLGFDQQEEGIVSYFQADNIASVKKLQLFNNLLYQYSDQQMGIIHATVGGVRKSTKLNNPESAASIEF
jgi:hypothetical protein